MVDQGHRAETRQQDAKPKVGYRVVVAETDPTVLSLLRDQVAALGYAVVGESRHWSSALDLAHALRPDLLIINLELPGADFERLRGLIAAQPALEVIGVAYAGYPETEAAKDTGMRHYLPRPFGLGKLEEAIAHATAARQGRR
jgi:DNA-binding NarL/FixJ family response regulator